MCSECLMTPCHSRCPNADEPKAIYKCPSCNEGIYRGDDCIEINGTWYHADCLTLEDLLELFDLEVCECE